MAKQPLNIDIPEEAGPRYKLIKEIKDSPLYKKEDRSQLAYNYIKKHIEAKPIGHNAVPGQLIVFEYFEPKTKDQLEYYDAYPCTIFFNTFQSKDGLRILGFNIHYYPPKMRFRVMAKIFDIYKPLYTKYFNAPLTKELDAFDYKYLMDALKKAKLDFGVREYIPELVGKSWCISANMWQVAVFTEGRFKKVTREAIMKYWNDWKSNYYNKKKKTDKSADKKADNATKKDNFFKRLFARFKRKK